MEQTEQKEQEQGQIKQDEKQDQTKQQQKQDQNELFSLKLRFIFITDPETKKQFFANLRTGDCYWEQPKDGTVKFY